MNRLVVGIITLAFVSLCFTGCSTSSHEDAAGEASQDATEVVSNSDSGGGGSAKKPSGSGSR